MRQFYRGISYPEKTLKSIKFKRFLKQIGYNADFTGLDIYLKKLNNFQSTKVNFLNFESILIDMLEQNLICKEKLAELVSKQSEPVDGHYINKLSKLIELKDMHRILNQLYDNFGIVFKLLSHKSVDTKHLNYSSFMHYCKIFRLMPDYVSCRKITFFFDLISQETRKIDLNQFIEIILLIFMDVFKIEEFKQLSDILNELCIFLIRLDSSGGWDKLAKEGYIIDNRIRFANGIVCFNN